MKALSLWQPWASLMAFDAKRIETRAWSTSYRGDVVICAAKKFPSDAEALCHQAPFNRALMLGGLKTVNDVMAVCGHATCVVEIYDCVRFSHDIQQLFDDRPDTEVFFGDYTVGRYGFLTRNVRRLYTPVPVSGNRNIFDISEAEEKAIRAQLDEAAR